MANRFSNFLRDDTKVIESMDEGFDQAEKKASLRHGETIEHFGLLNARFDDMMASNKALKESNKELAESNRKLIESVTKKEKDPQVLEIAKRQLFSGTSEDNNVAVVEDSQSVAGDSVLSATTSATDVTSATSAAQRRLQKLKQKERELLVKQKQMDEKQKEEERKLNRLKKQMHEKVEKDRKKEQHEHQIEMQKMLAQLKANDTKHAKEVATLKKELEAKLGLMEKEKENMTNSNGSIFDIKPMPQKPPEPEQKAMNEHVRVTRASRARARGGK